MVCVGTLVVTLNRLLASCTGPAAAADTTRRRHNRGVAGMGSMVSAEPINFQRLVLEPIKFEEIQ